MHHINCLYYIDLLSSRGYRDICFIFSF